MTSAAGQVRAVVRALVAAGLNSLRRRQGAGAMVIFPMLVAVLAFELARFGGRGAAGVRRVLALTADRPEKGTWWVALWLSLLAVALTALKLSRSIPGRGSRRYFDTPMLRALPVSPLARAACELAAGHARALGFVLVVWTPAVWGLARAHHGRWAALALTVAATLAVNSVTTLAAMAVDGGLSRRLDGRRLDLLRVASSALGIGLVGLFTAGGPIGAGIAHHLRVGGRAPPSWTPLLPLWGFVEWTRFGARPAVVFAALAPALLVSVASAAALARGLRHPGDVSLDAPSETVGPRRWEPHLPAWRVELRMLVRQAPWLPLGPLAFVAFFFALARLAPKATRADLPFLWLMGLTGWAFVVLATALSGATARRWRRVLWVPAAAGRDHRATVRAVAVAHTLLTAPLALGVFATLLYATRPGALFFLRMVPGLAAAIAVGHWALSAAVFLLIDPSPDRLSGLSVAAVFGVLTTAVPTAALLMLLSALPLATWLPLLGLLALFAWSMERSAAERLRAIRDPDGDPAAPLRSWPALRGFGVATLAQLLVTQLAEAPLGLSQSAQLGLGYLGFAAVMIPLGWAGQRRHATKGRWSLPRALAVGVTAGLANFAVAMGYARLASRVWGEAAGPLTQGLAHAHGLWRPLLVACAALLGPVAEELLFRGWLQPALARDLPRRLAPLAPVVAAAVFAALHMSASWPMTFASGLLAGWLMQRSGRVEASAAMHVVSNTLVVASALAG